MDLKLEWDEFKKESAYFALGFIAAWALIVFLIESLGASLTSYFENLLGIPFNIHHDLIGLLGLLGVWIFREKFSSRDKWALAGFFLGLFVQGVLFAGAQFITYL